MGRSPTLKLRNGAQHCAFAQSHAFLPPVTVLLLLLLSPSYTVANPSPFAQEASSEPADLTPFETIDSAVDAGSFGPHLDIYDPANPGSSAGTGAGGGGGGVGVGAGARQSALRVAQLRGASAAAVPLASGDVTSGDSSHVARLYRLSKKQYRARCLDGSPAGYYLRRGFGSGASNWIMILEAGGWCFNAKSCANRAKGPLGSSKSWPPTSNVVYGGVGSTNGSVNPAFYNWNLVLVKYCDGSSFTGGYGKLKPNAETGMPLYFRGHWNLQSTIQDLLNRQGLKTANQMLVGGCSAGGVASSIKCDQISRWMAGYNITTKCFMDGGFFPDVQDEDGKWTMRQKVQQMATVHGMARSGINAECKRAMARTNETWKCFFPEYNLQFARYPMLIVNSLADYKAISLTLAPRPKGTSDPLLRCLRSSYRTCNPGQVKLLQAFSTKVSSSIGNLVQMKASEKNGIEAFTFSQSAHCVVGEELWQKVQSTAKVFSSSIPSAASPSRSPPLATGGANGASLASTFSNWYRG